MSSICARCGEYMHDCECSEFKTLEAKAALADEMAELFKKWAHDSVVGDADYIEVLRLYDKYKALEGKEKGK